MAAVNLVDNFALEGNKELFKKFIGPAAGHWAEIAKQNKEERIHGIADVVDDMARQLVYPGLEDRGFFKNQNFGGKKSTAKMAIAMAIMDSGLPIASRFNISWRRRRTSLHNALLALNEDVSKGDRDADTWPHILGNLSSGDYGLPSGLRARELNSANALSEEGNCMGHCVGDI